MWGIVKQKFYVMSLGHLGHRGIGYLALLLSATVAVVAVALSASPVLAQSEGCQFLVTVRNPNAPIDFSGPAGGNDFALSDASRNPAEIVLTNIYGSESCGWTLTPSQDWVSLNEASGILQAGEEFIVTVSINDRASHLARGRHEAQIAIRSPQAARTTRGGRTRILHKQSMEVVLYAQLPCDLTLTGGSYSARALRGGVPPDQSVAKLSNAGDAPCHWEAHSNRPWLTVDPASGTTLGKDIGGFRIRANAGAARLVPGDYDATVTLTWSETGPEALEIEAILEIDAPPCELHFAEGQRFEARGKAGSTDFSASQTKFLLENRGGTPCHTWEAHHSAQWLSINSETTIYPGNATEVVVELDERRLAETPPGTYNSMITFGAGNQYAGSNLDARLIVEPLPCHLEIEIEEEELYFRIEPEGLLESETEKPIVLRNSWKNRECHWRAEALSDWLTAEPPSGILTNDETTTVVAKIVRTDAVAELEPGTHSVRLGFAVDEGTTDHPVDVTLSIECKLDEPCAYLHATHTLAAIQEEVKINLALYNPLERNIVAQLRLVVPQGWNVESNAFAERCSSVCNDTDVISPGEQKFIELFATPNNSGIFEFTGSVVWEAERDSDSGDATVELLKTSPLQLGIDVSAPSGDPVRSGNTLPQVAPTVEATPAVTTTPAAAPTATPEEPAPTTAPGAPPPPPADGSAPEGPIIVQQIGLPPIIWAALAGIVALLAIGVIASLFRRRRRRTPAVQIDYDELARAMRRQGENPAQE